MKSTLSILSILSLAFVITVAGFGQTASAQQTKPEHFSKRQLNTLIASAKTPAEHQRIAQYYQAKAQDYLAQAKEHEQMLTAYNANPSIGGKARPFLVDHCKYFSKELKDMAIKSQELAQLHEQMANDKEQK